MDGRAEHRDLESTFPDDTIPDRRNIRACAAACCCSIQHESV